jgi:hypothetical protein
MAERDIHPLRAQALAALAEATQAANSDTLMRFAHVAAAVCMAQGGPEFLRLLA